MQQQHFGPLIRDDGVTFRLWAPATKRVDLLLGHDQLLLTDGLRTLADFNHTTGCKRLFADMSTDWWYDAGSSLRDTLPTAPLPPIEQQTTFDEIWGELGMPTK